MQTIEIHGREVEIRISPAARRRLAGRDTPLLAEMELYFSCLIRKKVRFRDATGEDAVHAHPGLRVCFRPVTTAQCCIADAGDEVPLTAMPVREPARFVPHWLRLDFRRGDWIGEFGYLS